MKAAVPICLFFASLGLLPAQTIVLKNGQEISAESLRRSGPTVFARIQVAGGGSGEVGHAAAAIERIEFPRPAALAEAEDLRVSGRFDEALKRLAGVIDPSTPFRDLRGSWWAPAMLKKVRILLDAGRGKEAETTLPAIPKAFVADADVIDLLRADILVQKQDLADADALYDAIRKRTHNDSVAAQSWVGTGTSRLAAQDAEGALLAFLRVPVLYPAETNTHPAALIGSARSAAALGDQTEAAAAVEQLVTAHPSSVQAAQARREFPTLIPSNEK